VAQTSVCADLHLAFLTLRLRIAVKPESRPPFRSLFSALRSVLPASVPFVRSPHRYAQSRNQSHTASWPANIHRAISPAANTPTRQAYRLSLRGLFQFHKAKNIITGMPPTDNSRSNTSTEWKGAVAKFFGSSNLGRGHLDRTRRTTHASMYGPATTSHGVIHRAENHHLTGSRSDMVTHPDELCPVPFARNK